MFARKIVSPVSRRFISGTRQALSHDHDHPHLMFEKLPFKKSTIRAHAINTVGFATTLILVAVTWQNYKHGFWFGKA